MRPAYLTTTFHAVASCTLAIVLSLGGSGAAFAAPPRPVRGMSALDRLVAEDEIRQKVALFALYADGDGEKPKDVRALADQLLTPDVVVEVISGLGVSQSRTVGRDAVVAATAPALPNQPTAGRHFVVATYFDDITPSTAHTRTTALYVNVTRNMVGADCQKAGLDACGGRVVRSVLLVYHDTWVKGDAGWQKSHSVLRLDN
jgi:hypothetical protein